jgi:hypothetical protein
VTCPRCEATGPVTSAVDGCAVSLLPGSLPRMPDPEFPTVRLFGMHGPKAEPPPGFEAPRICLACGVVYYPKIGARPNGS